MSERLTQEELVEILEGCWAFTPFVKNKKSILFGVRKRENQAYNQISEQLQQKPTVTRKWVRSYVRKIMKYTELDQQPSLIEIAYFDLVMGIILDLLKELGTEVSDGE